MKKLGIGQEWITRGGLRVRLIEHDPGFDWPWGSDVGCWHDDDGRTITSDIESDLDLVSMISAVPIQIDDVGGEG